MADKTVDNKQNTQSGVQDDSFTFGSERAPKKVGAWDGENVPGAMDEAGQMSLANLHYGSAPEGDLTKSVEHPEETGLELSHDATASGEAGVSSAVLENSEGAVVGVLSSFDPDAGDSVTYTVSDDRFEVVGGELRLAEGVSLDHEAAETLDVTVIATDSDGLSTEENFIVDVLDVNEAPTDLALEGTSVAENDAGAVVGTLSSFDPDAGDTVTYTVSDARFEVVDGELRLAEGVSLDHEAAETLDVTVTATDGEGLSTTETFTVDVLDVNEGPSDVTLDGSSVSENDAGAVVGTLSSFDPDSDDSVAYTVSDDRFEVVDGELRLAEGVSLDHEAAETLDVTVTATDSGGLSTEETFTVDVLDVNEGPADLALDGSPVSENEAGAVVGTLSSFDPDAGDSVAYTVSDARFEVVDGELRLADGVSLDHEAAETLDVTVTATDGGGLSTEETFTVDVLDVNEGPTDLALDGSSVAENDAGAVVGTLSSFDPDSGDSVAYTVSDARFEVVDGELRLAEGVSLDHEAVDSLEVTVTATDSDGLSTSEDFTVAVDDVNEAPTDLELVRETVVADADFSAGDGSSGDSVERLGLESDAIVFTMSFSTSDDVDAPQTLFETGGTVYGTSVVIHDGMIKVYAGEGNDLELSVPVNGDTTYSLALELDMSSDSIKLLMSDELPLAEMNEGNSLVASHFDWDDRDYTGSNGMGVGRVSGNAQGSIGGDFQGVIEGPGLQIFSESTFADVLSEAGIEENAEGAVVGTLSSFDPDAGDTVSYTVSDDRFEVVDGDLKLKDDVSLDHESEPAIDITVTATDSGGLSVDETFTIDVVDVNEAPDDLTLDGNTVSENTVDGVVGTVSVSDPDAGDTHTYSLIGNEGLPFAIDAQTGEISVVTPGIPDGSVLRIDASETDSVSSDDGVSTIADLSGEGNTIRQTDADERPDVTADGPFGAAGLQFDGENDRLEISDDSALNLSSQSERSFALTVKTGDDVDTRQVIYEEGGTINGFNFYIDDGQLYMGAWSNSTGWSFEAVNVDIEADTSYSIVSVYDGASNTYTGYVNGENVGSVEVGDVMSAHSGDIGLGGVSQHTFFHDGSSSANNGFNFEGSVGEFAVFNDALTGADVAAVDMDFRGVSADIDFETQSSYDLTVQVTDAAGESYQEVVTIDVTDLNEGPVDLILDGSSVAENDAGAVVGTLSSFDPDADDSVAYTVSDARFEVVDGELRLAEGESLDHETADSLDVTVTATDSGGLSTEETFTVDVLDVNEAPSDLALDNASVAENDVGAVVGNLSSFDPDAGDTVSYTVSDDRFEVVDGELRLADGVSFDHEAVESLDVTVTATDSDGLSTSEDFTINVDDVNEAPTDLELTSQEGSLSLNEDGGHDDNAISANVSDFPTDAITVEVTFTSGNMPEGSGAPLFSYAADGGHNNEVLLWAESSSGDLNVFLGGQKFNTGISNSELFDGEEHTVSMTWDQGTNELNVFVDGEAEYSRTVDVRDLKTDGTITLGQEQDAEGGRYDAGQVFEGEIAEVRIYDQALSEDDIASNTGGEVSEAGLVTNWRMDEATDGVVADTAGNNDLVLENEAHISSVDGDGTLSVDENVEGAVVGTLSSIDPDAGDTVAYTVSDDRFEVVDGELKLKDDVSLDHRDAESLDVTVTATDSGGLSTEETFTVDVLDVNEAPTDLALDGSSVSENEAGATVGTLSSFDPDADDSVTYAVSDARFEVVDGELRLAEGVSLDHEAADSLEVTVTATDSEGLSTSEDFTITVDDVNEAPTDLELTSEQGVLSLNEDGGKDDNAISANVSDFPTDAITVEVSFASENMPEGSGAPLFSYSGDGNWGNDVLLWAETSSGNLSVFLDGQQFRTDIPNADLFDGEDHTVSFTWDQGSDELNVYVDGALEFTRTVDVDGLEAGGTITLGQEQDSQGGGYDSRQVFEGEIAEVRIYDQALSGDDIAGNASGDVSEEGLVTNWLMDEAVDGVVSDAAGNNDLVLENEAHISSVDGDGVPSLDENAEGAVVGTLSSFDPDAGDTVTYTVSDERFEVVDGELKLKDDVSLDHEEVESLDVTVTATDSGGLSSSEDFTININDVNEAPSDLTLTSSSDNFVFGGSFEGQSVNSGGWRGFASDETGNWTSANGIEVWDNLWGNSASEGNQFLELDYTNAADAIEQSISTEAGQVYTLSFDAKARGGSTTDTIEVYWNGEQVSVIDPSSTSWESVDFNVIGTGGDDVLEFREAAGESDSLGAHLDNISLVEATLTVAENVEGASVGMLSAFDPDAGDSIAYTVSDARFEVVDGELRLAEGVSLDHEATETLDVTVTATDGDGLSTGETFAISVEDVAEDVQLADGRVEYTESGVTETSVTGGDGDDTMRGGTGDDVFLGGAGDDLFIYEAGGGSDTIDGGEGWTDTIDLSAASDTLGVYGEDWTVTLTEGEIVDVSVDALELSDDAAGVIDLGNGDVIDFTNIEQVGF